MKRIVLVGLSLVLVTSLFLPAGWGAAPTLADGNNRLGAAFNFTLRGDVVAAGEGLRSDGVGSLTLGGIPAGALVFRAFLYWATLGNVDTYTSPIFNGVEVIGDLIGTSGDTCWGVQNNFVYRADVTDLVPGNGTYSISGLPNDLSFGNDSQGASLVVVYQDQNLPFRSILIHDGAVSLDLTNNTYTDVFTTFVPASPVSDAHITYLIGDGQAAWDAGNLTFNGSALASGVFSGVDGDYWGTHTFDVTSLVSAAPATTTLNNNDPGNPDSPDCLLWAATIFSVTIPEPEESDNNLSEFLNTRVFGDVTAVGVGLRGTGEGDLVLTGLPLGATVERALLYWATLGNSGRYLDPELNGMPYIGELIGASGDTCWGVLNNYVYRADVTNQVQANGTYRISGLPSSLADGNDSQGASLVVIFRAPSPTLYRTIIINDGAVTLDLDTTSYTDTIDNFTADQPNARAHITYLIGDGQERWDNGDVLFEGTSIANNVFTGVDGDYWGTPTFDVTGLVVEPGATTTISNMDSNNPDSPDCLLWAGTVFSVETEPPMLEARVYLPFVMRDVVVAEGQP